MKGKVTKARWDRFLSVTLQLMRRETPLKTLKCEAASSQNHWKSMSLLSGGAHRDSSQGFSLCFAFFAGRTLNGSGLAQVFQHIEAETFEVWRHELFQRQRRILQ